MVQNIAFFSLFIIVLGFNFLWFDHTIGKYTAGWHRRHKDRERMRFFRRFLYRLPLFGGENQSNGEIWLGVQSRLRNYAKFPVITPVGLTENKIIDRIFSVQKPFKSCKIKFVGEINKKKSQVGIVKCNHFNTILKDHDKYYQFYSKTETVLCLPVLFSRIKCELLYYWIAYYVNRLKISLIFIYSSAENKLCHKFLLRFSVVWEFIPELDSIDIHYHGQLFAINELFLRTRESMSWIGFFDMDEFLVIPSNYTSLFDYLNIKKRQIQKEFFSFGSYLISNYRISDVYQMLHKESRNVHLDTLKRDKKPECKKNSNPFFCSRGYGRRKYFANPRNIDFLNVHWANPEKFSFDIDARESAILHYRGLSQK